MEYTYIYIFHIIPHYTIIINPLYIIVIPYGSNGFNKNTCYKYYSIYYKYIPYYSILSMLFQWI